MPQTSISTPFKSSYMIGYTTAVFAKDSMVAMRVRNCARFTIHQLGDLPEHRSRVCLTSDQHSMFYVLIVSTVFNRKIQSFCPGICFDHYRTTAQRCFWCLCIVIVFFFNSRLSLTGEDIYLTQLLLLKGLPDKLHVFQRAL